MMKLSAPKLITWWIALIFGAVAVLTFLIYPPFKDITIWVATVGLALMLVSTATKGL